MLLILRCSNQVGNLEGRFCFSCQYVWCWHEFCTHSTLAACYLGENKLGPLPIHWRVCSVRLWGTADSVSMHSHGLLVFVQTGCGVVRFLLKINMHLDILSSKCHWVFPLSWNDKGWFWMEMEGSVQQLDELWEASWVKSRQSWESHLS